MAERTPGWTDDWKPWRWSPPTSEPETGTQFGTCERSLSTCRIPSLKFRQQIWRSQNLFEPYWVHSWILNTCLCVRLQELKSDSSAAYGSSGSGTPQVVSSSVRILAQALTHIEQGIERRFLKAPLGESLARPGFVRWRWCQTVEVDD